MHFYEIDIAKAMKHRKPFVLNPTNYILTTDDELYQLTDLPEGVPYITQEQMVEQLYTQSLVEIERFLSSEHNKNVYVMAVTTNEFYDFHLYTNTEEQYKKSHEQYFTESKNSIQMNHQKYNLGDFSFHNQIHNDEIIKILDGRYMIDEKILDFEMDELPVPMYTGDFKDISIIMNQSLVEYGHYIAVQEVVKRLKDKGIQEQINSTTNFIFYAAVDGDVIDWSLMMRQTVKCEVLYDAIPKLNTGDIQFDQLKVDLQQRSFHEQIHYWLQEIKNHEPPIGESIFEHCYKTEYHAIEALAENINDIANDLLPAWKKAVVDYIDKGEESTALFYLSYVLSECEEQKQEYLQEIKDHLNRIEQAEQQQEESQENIKMIRNILMVE